MQTTYRDLLEELHSLLNQLIANDKIEFLTKWAQFIDLMPEYDGKLLEEYKKILGEINLEKEEPTEADQELFRKYHIRFKQEGMDYISRVEKLDLQSKLEEDDQKKIQRIFEIVAQLADLPEEKFNKIVSILIDKLIPNNIPNNAQLKIRTKLSHYLFKQKEAALTKQFSLLPIQSLQGDTNTISEEDLIQEYCSNTNNKNNITFDGSLKRISETRQKLGQEWTVNGSIDTQKIHAWFLQARRSVLNKDEHNTPETSKTRDIPDIFLDIIAAMDIVNQLVTQGNRLRIPQIMAIIIFMCSKQRGHIAQISTGEGKTTIISFLQALKVFQGYKAHVITSNEVLAADAVRDREKFYHLLGISVADNNPGKSLATLRASYSKDIVYGSINNFQFDWLRHSFEDLNVLGASFNFDRVWVTLDEIDSLLIDQGGNLAKLSSPFPGMEGLRYVYMKIWWALLDVESDLLNNPEALFVKEVITHHFIEQLKQKVTEKTNSLFENPDLKQFLPNYLLKYAIRSRIKWIETAIVAKYSYQEDVEYKIISTSEERQIIVPIDNQNTGVTQRNTNLSDGLHQFLQLKHGLELTYESLTSSFISNINYILKYKNKLSGLTGTMGGETEKALLQSVYTVDFSIVPRYKKRDFQIYPGEVYPNENFLEKIALKALWELCRQSISFEENPRSVLIICSSINDAEQLKDTIEKEALISGLKPNLKLYRDEQESFVTEGFVGTNEIIIATNIAGRGTDFKTTQALEDNGGLHVIVAFLPCNERVEAQACGRTARTGNLGSAQIIVRDSEVMALNITDSSSFDDILSARNTHEEKRLKKICNQKIKELYFKDALFECFSEMYKKLLRSTNKDLDDVKVLYLADDLKEQWAFWLSSREENIAVLLEGDGAKETMQLSAQNLFQKFENEPSVISVVQDYVITQNPHYAIKLAQRYLEECSSDNLKKAKLQLENVLKINAITPQMLSSAYITLFEVAIEQGSQLLERYKKALAEVFLISVEKNENYKKYALSHLQKAEEFLKIEHAYLYSLLQEKDLSKIVYQSNHTLRQTLPEQSAQKSGSFFQDALVSRYTCLDIYLENVKSLIKQLQETQQEAQKEADLIIGTKIPRYLAQLDSPIEVKKAIQNNTVIELERGGINAIYQLQEVHDVPSPIIHSAQGQILAGFSLLTTTIPFPFLLPIHGPIAGTLISEGVGDLVMALIDQGETGFNSKDYLKAKCISYGISIITLGMGAIASSTRILTKAQSLCRSFATKLKNVDGPFATICNTLAKNLDKLSVYFEKSIKSIKFSRFNAIEQSEHLVHLKEAKNIAEFQRLQKLVSVKPTIMLYAKDAITSTVTSTAFSLLNEKIIIACLNRLCVDLHSYIEKSIKENLDNKLHTDSALLEKHSRHDFEKSLEHLFDTDFSEDIRHIAQEISLGVMRHSNDWKAGLIALAFKSLITTIDVNSCTDKIYAKFLNLLPPAASEPSSDNYTWLSDAISKPLADMIYAKIVGLVGEIIITVPKSFYARHKQKQEKKNDQKIVKQIEEREFELDSADILAKKMNCAHEAVGESLGINSRQLADATSILPSVHGADIAGICELYHTNAIDTVRADVRTAAKKIKQYASDRAIACLTARDNKQGHAIHIRLENGQFVVASKGNISLEKYCLAHGFDYHQSQFIVPKALNKNTQKEIQIQTNRNRIVRAVYPTVHIGYYNGKIVYGTLGGSYNALNKAHPKRSNVIEINHVPPDNSYKETPYQNITYGTKPAMAMKYHHHRNAKDGVGAASSTGSSNDAIEYRAQLRTYLNNREYWKAVLMDCKDTLNTAISDKTRDHYIPHILSMLRYMRDVDIPNAPLVKGIPHGRLINQQQFAAIVQGLGISNIIDFLEPHDYGGHGLSNYKNISLWSIYTAQGLEQLLMLRVHTVTNQLFNIQSFLWYNNLLATTKLVSEIMHIPGLLKNTTFIPINLLGKHWVGIVIEKQGSNIRITYMDSEKNTIPSLLKEILIQQFSNLYTESSIVLDEKIMELQRSNNCGPEVIENFVSYITGGVRLDQESAVAVHSLLFEDALLQEVSTTHNNYRFWSSQNTVHKNGNEKDIVASNKI